MSANPDRVPTDAELLAAVAEGDPEAFGTLYDLHAPWLLVRLRQRTTNQDLADQVAQEAFLVVWRNAGRFGGRGEVGAWIWGIAIRRLLDAERGAAAQGRLAGLLGRQRIPDAASAEEQALTTLEQGDVIRALNRLAPELQAVLQATVLDGLSTREAAVLLGIPAGTVKTRARRALVDPARLRRLRAALIDAVDLPRAGMAERLLVRLGVADHTARLLAATPALRGSWLLAVAAALAFAVLAAWAHPGQDANLAFLCVAPLLPLAGIAAAYGPGIDPTYEIGLAAPLSSFRLLLLRSTAVLGTATTLAAAASLALATTVAPPRAIGITAGAWILAVVVTVLPPAPSSVLFAVAGQAGFAALALLAAAVLLVRRGRFESDRGFDTTPRFAARRLR